MNNPVEVRNRRARSMILGASVICVIIVMLALLTDADRQNAAREVSEEPLTVSMVTALNNADIGDTVVYRDGRVCLVEEHPKGSGLLKMRGRACDQGRMRIMTLAGSVAHVFKKDSPEHKRTLECLGILKFEENGRRVDYSKWHC